MFIHPSIFSKIKGSNSSCTLTDIKLPTISTISLGTHHPRKVSYKSKSPTQSVQNQKQ